MNYSKSYLIVNFGGPRNLQEIRSFLTALLTDRDVIRTNLPAFLQRWLFTYVAKKRSLKIAHDYSLIGGKSPIFEDTEEVAKAVGELVGQEILTFHRYLPATHQTFIEKIEGIAQKEIIVFPMFPQFTYATTGSIARWFQENLSEATLRKMSWIKSYPTDEQFISCQVQILQNFLERQQLSSENTVLFFSAHGLPKIFIDTGDVYKKECERSFEAIMKAFPGYDGLLAYQSKFGRGEWIRPYTNEMCEQVLSWNQGKENIVFVPISFTSDHIETLFEVEYQYLPVLREKGLNAFRSPALGLDQNWVRAIASMFSAGNFLTNDMLIRK